MHPDAFLLKFLDRVEADLGRGDLLPVEAYVEAFPEHAALIRAEYVRLSRSDAPEATRLDRTIGRRYRVLESLGRGGYGEVLLAEDTMVRRRVAIKVLTGLGSLSPGSQKRLLREAEATSRIGDPGICPIHDVGTDHETPFLVMPWIRGQPLDRLIADSAARGEGPMQLGTDTGLLQRRDSVLATIEQLARTLRAAHEAGVVHRDVKPANILIQANGVPVLIDFGLAWLATPDATGSRSTAFGTPSYCAPEVLSGGSVPADPRLDVWSLGAVLFECLTLRRPFLARPGVSLERCLLEDPLPQLDRRLGRDLQAVVEKALRPAAADRYADMAAFADDLRRIRRHQPVSVRAAGPVRRLLGRLRARPAAFGVGVAAATALLAIAVLATIGWARSRERAAITTAIGAVTGAMDQILRDADLAARMGVALAPRAAEAERLLGTARALRAEIGASPDIDRSLARVLTAVAALQLQLGNPGAASQHLEEAQPLLERLLLQVPDPIAEQEALAHARVLLGDACNHVGDFPTALRHFRAALAIDMALLERFPDQPRRHSDVGFGHLRIGQMLAHCAQLEAAFAEQQRALAQLQEAERRDPDNAARPGHTATALLELLRTARGLGHSAADCEPWLVAAEPRLRRLAEQHPQHAAACELRIQYLTARSELASDPAAKLALTAEMVDAATQAAMQDPASPYLQATLSGVLRDRADALLDAGDLAGAANAAERALVASERALAALPESWLFVGAQTSALVAAARVDRATQQHERCQQRLDQALRLAEAYWQQQPAQQQAVLLLARLLLHDSLGERRDPQRALAVLEQCLARVDDASGARMLAELAAKAQALLTR